MSTHDANPSHSGARGGWVWKRTLRTASSERFLAVDGPRDLASCDLHYLPGGTVAGTVIVLTDSGLADSDIPRLLQSLDDDMLPGAELADGTVLFTVVRGSVLGSFEGAGPGQ